MKEDTPIIKQWKEIKQDYPNSILFYRVGDFYEMFYEDAKKSSRLLNLVLTKRRNKDESVPMSGIPHHSSESYISKLLNFGETIALCEQIGEASNTLMKREVVRVLTKGTLIEDNLLSKNNENILSSIAFNKKSDLFGVTSIEVSTGRIYISEVEINCLSAHLDKISPSEIISTIDDFDIVESNTNHTNIKYIKKTYSSALMAKKEILEIFNIKSLDSIGELTESGIFSTSLCLSYIQDKLKIRNFDFSKINIDSDSDKLFIDQNSLRNLEINNISTGDDSGSLLDVMNFCKTSMGFRNLKRWVNSPSTNLNLINNRLDAIDEIKNKNLNIHTLFENIVDIERIMGRVSLSSCSPKDLLNLKNFLIQLEIIAIELKPFKTEFIVDSYKKLKTKTIHISDLLSRSINENATKLTKDGDFIKDGFDDELDELRSIVKSNTKEILKFEKNEREKTGINNLKVCYSQKNGFYIEVSKQKISQIPKSYQRKQTLKNSERYISESLTLFENKIFSSKTKSLLLEKSIFSELVSTINNHKYIIRDSIDVICNLDCIFSLATLKNKFNLIRPTFNSSRLFEIKNGRNIILESIFNDVVPNDTYLNDKKTSILITGPNMGGKSTYMRQNATIVMLAHIGSFVPADYCCLPRIDKIFTRIGASDKLHKGLSTFMVEMIESAFILNNATTDSLVIMDEVGRGTSNEDGYALAWSILEKISKDINSYNLFATHYSDLSEISNNNENILNYHFTASINEGGIIFSHKIEKGAAKNSYGIEVAKMAGIPKETILLAEKKMIEYNDKNNNV